MQTKIVIALLGILVLLLVERWHRRRRSARGVWFRLVAPGSNVWETGNSPRDTLRARDFVDRYEFVDLYEREGPSFLRPRSMSRR